MHLIVAVMKEISHQSMNSCIKRKRRNKMNQNILEGKWKQLRGAIREKWGDLTDDELDQIAGKRDKLAGLLQEKYGYTQVEVEHEIDEFLERWEVPTN
jgi:uncharacterized protein YjbJ (UPF0337 family)